MAKWVLLNSVPVGSQQRFAGETFDDTVTNLAPIQAAGGVLLPATNATIAAAAALAVSNRRRGQEGLGLNQGIMLAAALQSAGSAVGSTMASVTAGSTYTALASDSLIEVAATAAGSTVKFEAAPVKGSQHTVKNTTGDSSANPITIDGNGKNVEDPNLLQTFSATVQMKVAGASATWIYDGTHWVLV